MLPPRRHLLVLPVYDRVEREVRDRARLTGWADSEGVVTLARLIDDLTEAALAAPPADAWWAGRQPASVAELALARRRAIARVRTRRDLDDRDQLLLRSGGLPRLLARLFDECAEGGVSAEELGAFAVSDDGGPRLALLAQLYAGYRRELELSGLLDPADGVRIALAAARDPRIPLPTSLADVALIEVRDVFDWSALRLELVVALASRLFAAHGPPERVQLVVPYSHEGRRLFHYMERTLRELEARHDVPLAVEFRAIEDAASTSGAPARVAATLFAEPPMAPERQAEVADAISLRACPGRSQELRTVAREVRALLDAGARPDDIVLALRHPERDWRPAASALARYGVPWHYRRGQRLADTPLLRHVADLFAAVAEGFPVAAVERILTSAFTSSPADTGQLSDARLVALLRDAGVRDEVVGARDGESGYRVRLRAFVERQRARETRETREARATPQPPARPARRSRGAAPRGVQGDLWAPPNAAPPSDSPAVAVSVRQVESILQRLDALATLRAPRSVAAWADDTARLLLHPGFDPARALRRTPLAHPERDHPDALDRATAAATAESAHAIEALRRVLAQLPDAAGARDLELGPAGFVSLLLEIAREVSLNPAGGRGAAVRIVPVRQLAGERVGHVFLPHLEEGDFPAQPTVDPLLRDHDRFRFNRWRDARARETAPPPGAAEPLRPFAAFRLDEPQPEDEQIPVRRSEETILFALALAAAQERAHLSWSTRDRNGRPVLPSLFVDALAPADARGERPLVEVEPVEVIPTLPHVVRLEELAQVAVAEARLGVEPRPDEPWTALARSALPEPRAASVLLRARVERARHAFFEVDDGAEALRDPAAAALASVPAELHPYLGYLRSAEVRERVRRDRFAFDAVQPASASRLSRYGECPARFFYQDLLRVEPLEPIDEEMDVRTRGGLLHHVLDRFYDHLREAGFADLRVLAGPDRPLVVGILERTLHVALRELEGESHFGHPDLLGISERAIRDSILALLDNACSGEPRLRLPVTPPARSEWEFGSGENPVSVELGADHAPVHLRGRIDRVDDLGAGRLLVSDYKSGKSGTYQSKLTPEQLDRTDFQLPIYAHAARTGLGAEAVDVQFVCLADGFSAGLDWEALEPLVVESAPPPAPPVVDLRDGIRAVVDGIAEGVFAPAARTCRFCSFSDVCRVSARVRERGWS
jgi:superfamily I DNA/RNA helicase